MHEKLNHNVLINFYYDYIIIIYYYKLKNIIFYNKKGKRKKI
jgi:hypothetical protein